MGETDAGTFVTVEYEDGSTSQVELKNGTGGIIGEVLTDAGFGLPDAAVTLIGFDDTATSNRTGWFQILSVPPGDFVLYVSHPQYRAAESRVVVKADSVAKVVVTLMPRGEGDAGDRPHVHDYWGDRTEATVINADFPFYPDRFAGPYGTYDRYYRMASTAAGYSCMNGPSQTAVTPWASPFAFDVPNQTVWPGTATIRITITWGGDDMVGSSVVGIAWRTPDADAYGWSPPIKSGEEFTIAVVPENWDSPHQRFTLWEFYVCATGKGESSTLAPGRVWLGEYHVEATLVKGHAIIADPPHPRFWANGTTITVLDEFRNVTAASSTALYATLATRSHSQTTFHFRPPEGHLVPPGAGRIIVNLTWEYDLPSGTRPLAIAFSPADIPPHEKTDLDGYMTVDPIDEGTNHRAYSIELDRGQTDGFYQAKSNWVFLWGVEDEEDPFVLYSCGCQIALHLVVVALADSPDEGEKGRGE